MNVNPIKTRVFKEGENLFEFIAQHIPSLKDGSILVLTSKIVALAEGRVVVLKSKKEKETWIRKESEWMQKVLPEWWLTVRDGTVVVNAGIDESNVYPVRDFVSNGAGGKMILLPKDSFASASRLHAAFIAKYGVKHLGIVVTDSRIAPLRAGVMGVALGYAGFKGVRDYRGTPDIFGRPLKVTQTNIADSLATAATVLMGEGAECQPLAVIEEAPVEFVDRVNRNELRIAMKEDMYRSLFASKTMKRRKR